MESESHQEAERYRESHLIVSLCQFLWESEGTGRVSPSRLGGEEERRIESIGQLLAYASLLPWYSFGVLKKSWEQSSPWSLMQSAGKEWEPGGLTPPTESWILGPERETDKGAPLM